MKITFYKGDEIKNKKEIINFCYEPFQKETDILDENTIAVLSTDKIIGVAFLLTDIKKIKKELHDNLVKQGVKEGDCYLYNFCISKEERKKGYGIKLLNECHNYLKNKCKNVFLFVESKNSGAIYLYNKAKYMVHMASSDGFVMKNNILDGI